MQSRDISTPAERDAIAPKPQRDAILGRMAVIQNDFGQIAGKLRIAVKAGNRLYQLHTNNVTFDGEEELAVIDLD